MPTLTIYDKDNNKAYSMTVNLVSTLTSTDAAATQEGQGRGEYYLTISTTLPNPDGNAFPISYIKTLADVPAGFPAASTFDELIRFYLEYFQSITIYESSSDSSSSSSSDVSSNSSDSSSSS